MTADMSWLVGAILAVLCIGTNGIRLSVGVAVERHVFAFVEPKLTLRMPRYPVSGTYLGHMSAQVWEIF